MSFAWIFKEHGKKYFEKEELKNYINTVVEHTKRIDRIRKHFIDVIGGLHDYVLKRTLCVPDIAGKGTGAVGAVYALIYEVLADNVQNVYLKDILPSFEEIIIKREYEYDSKLEVHGLLKNSILP